MCLGRRQRMVRAEFDKLYSVDSFGCLDMRLGCYWADGSGFANGHDMFGALLLEDALHALDSETLIVEEVTDTLEQLNVIRAIVSPPAATLEWLDLREPRFPETQHMLW